MHARVIAVYNRKGGTGKTTLTLAAASAAARHGAKVLLLDADPAQDAATVAEGWDGVTTAKWAKGWRKSAAAGEADLVLIDCPPDSVTPKAVFDADLVVLPVLPEPLTLRRLASLVADLHEIPWVVVINGYTKGVYPTAAVAELTESLGEQLWLPPIPRRAAFVRAQEHAIPVQSFRGRPADVLETTTTLATRMLMWRPNP